MTNYNERLDEITQSVFMAGLGIAGADDIPPEDKDIAILNTQKYFVGEAKQALTSLIKELVAEAKPEITFSKPEGMPNTLAIDFAQRHLNQFEQNLLKSLEEV